MLFLYPKNTTDFTNNGDPIHHSYDEHIIRDDGFYLTFSLLLDKEEGYKKVKKEMIIGANTPDGTNQFRVYNVKKKNTHVEVTAVQLMYDFDNKEVNPFSVKNATGNQVITKLRSSFKSSLGQFTMDSSVSEVHDFTTNEAEDDTSSHNALEILNRITSRWDSELMLNGFDIRMIKRLGNKTDALLYEKKNISEFEDSSSVSGMATRIHATSKFTPEGKENEVTLSVTVDSPLINEYAQIYEKSFVNNECRTEAELIAWVKLKYSTENIDKPSRSITVATNIIDGTEINYGDDLVLKYLVHDVDEVIRCVGYDYDPIRKTYYSVTLGDWKDSFLNTITSNIIDSTNKQFNQLKKNVTYISMSANGKNRNAYGPEPVPNPINGDNWYYYELDRPNDVEYRVFQDGFWVKLDFFATKKEVEGALAEAKEAKQEAIESYNNAIADAAIYTNTKAQEFDTKLLAVNQEIANVTQAANAAVTQANKAVEDAGFAKVDASAAKLNAATALENANTAKSNASTALTNAETAISTANTAKSNAGTALTNANAALDKVGSVEETTGALSTSYDALTKTVALKADQTTVDGIKGTVTTQGIAITANATAIGLKADKSVVDTINGTVANHTTDIKANSDGLKLKADSTTVNSIKGTVDTHTTQIKAASDGLTLKADKSQVDTIKGTVDKHTLDISANATAVGLKADKSVVDSIKGTVDKHTLDIKAAADGLTLKADSSLVNTIKGTVDTHTTQISANSTAINARLTSAQVETLLTGKKYVNETTLNATATGIRADITQVSSDLSNLEIGGRNYVQKSLDEIEVTNALTRETTYSYPKIKLEPNTEYTFSLEYSASSNTTSVDLFFVSDVGEHRSLNNLPQTNGAFVYKSFTFSTGSNPNQSGNPRIDNNGNTGGTSVVRARKVKIEKGNKATDWTPAPEDMATLEQFTTIEATVKGLQTTVGNKAEQSQVTQLAGQISSKVESAAYNSKMTQLDSAINLRVTKGDVTAQINVEAGVTLISNKKLLLDANTYIMGTTFANDVKAKSLEAVYADIATLKTKVLTADAITSTMVKSDTALVDKIFATDANVNRLTAKTAFINSVKAIDISADRVTAGTLNAANVAIINLNANNIVTGTISGANSSWNLNNGMMNFKNPSTGDNLVFTQGQIEFQNGGQGRLLKYNAEGLFLEPMSGNTGTSLNTSIHLNGGVDYIQFNNRLGTTKFGRLEVGTNSAKIEIPVGAEFRVVDVNNVQAPITANYFRTVHFSGYTLTIQQDRIYTIGDTTARNIWLEPNGTGSVVAGNRTGTRWNVVASDFVKQSSRTTKTNIVTLQGGLDVINALTPVSYNKIDKINQDIYEVEKGFISEDSPQVATPDGLGIYDSHVTAHLVKAVQELDSRTASETEELKAKIAELELKIQQLESAA